MARPKSDSKRSALLEAAAKVIVAEGLGGSTASIAKEAGVASGSIFTYYETKAELFNALYLELKSEMAGAAMKDFPTRAKPRDQALHVWRNWLAYASGIPHRRRALEQLTVSDIITPETRAMAAPIMAPFLELMERLRVKGPLRQAPPSFAAAIMSSIADVTAQTMIQDPARAALHCDTGFEAFWRAIT